MKKKKNKRIMEYALFLSMKFIVNLFPLKIRYKISNFFGILFYYLIKKRREIIFKNLDIAFPELSFLEKKKIAIKSCKNISTNFFELFWYEKISKKENYEIINNEILKKEYTKGKGVVLLTLHMGNWELGSNLTKFGYNLSAIARKQNNIYFDNYITKMRNFYKIDIILNSNKKILKPIIEDLKNKKCVIFLSDQFQKGTIVEFFHKKTRAPIGAPYLSLKTGAPVVLAYCIRDKKYGKFKIIIDKKIDIVKSNDFKDDLFRNTQNIFKDFERVIKKFPEQWFWQHNRWKDF